ncbi:hypothetical protein [Staphylococcus equorum]|uniref:hypothetical protein n=1 Tax=Staphylococcus equorum TaxID=246432 RepID=UPI0025532F35|nr:hypothetical protein [Staphylococcus equorum]MDK9870236.1 hypothetical protein [Staphylococcus equorum]
MKIKRKVQKTLPQLIEWAKDNGIKHRVFVSNPNFDGVTYKLGFDIGGDLYFEEALTPTLLFTVEVEEEITEDTEIEKLYHTTIPSRIVESGCSTIKSTLEHSTVEPIAFYILNDDLTMTLIWTHEKGLVE